MDSQTKNVKYNGHEIFKEHHKDNKNREKRPETMRNWEFIQNRYLQECGIVQAMTIWGKAGENQSTKDMHKKQKCKPFYHKIAL